MFLTIQQPSLKQKYYRLSSLMCYLSPTPDAPSLETRRDDDDGGGDRMVFGNNFTECCLKKMPLFCTHSWHFHK